MCARRLSDSRLPFLRSFCRRQELATASTSPRFASCAARMARRCLTPTAVALSASRCHRLPNPPARPSVRRLSATPLTWICAAPSPLARTRRDSASPCPPRNVSPGRASPLPLRLVRPTPPGLPLCVPCPAAPPAVATGAPPGTASPPSGRFHPSRRFSKRRRPFRRMRLRYSLT